MRFASNLLVAASVFLGCCACSPQRASAQAVSELPRAEYYLAKDLFGAGRTTEAADGFQVALNRARRVGEQRWVDSIPPLVMLGECFYQQGSLALALEQYDAALLLAIGHPDWIDQMEVGVEQLPALQNIAKGIDWFPFSQPGIPVAVPEAVQIAIDPTQAQAGPQGSVIAPVSLITRLDATEIFRTMGLAALRRWQILGPLAKHSPLTEPLDQLFRRQPAQRAAWVQGSWNVLRGINGLSTATPADAILAIRNGGMLGGQFDYFMTPLAFLAAAEVNARNGNFQAAVSILQDSAMVAAQFGQHAELADSLQLLAACAAASERTELVAPLQDVAGWCSKRSTRSQVAALLGAAELSVYLGDWNTTARLTKQCTTGLQSRELSLPRAQAQLAYVNALAGFGQDRGALGISNLDIALRLIRGTAQSGAVVERTFQAQTTLDLLAAGRLTARDAEDVLGQVIGEPTAADWQLEPLKTLASITTSSLPAYERLLSLSLIRGDMPLSVTRLDRLQKQRFYEAMPLGGRLLAWRYAIDRAPVGLPADVQATVDRTKQKFPELALTAQTIETLVAELRAGPVPLDERQLNADLRKAFKDLVQVSTTHENQLAFQTLLRKPLARFMPETTSVADMQQRLAADDILLSFGLTSQGIVGVAISPTELATWQVTDLKKFDELLLKLCSQIGLAGQPSAQLPSETVAPTAAWRTTSQDIAKLLLPDAVRQVVASSKRVLIAPSDRLWYLPFGLLPVSTQAGADPLLAGRSITYLPTIGSLSAAFAPRPQIKDTIGLVAPFFSIDKDNNALAAQRLANMPGTSQIVLGQKTNVAAPAWLRARMDQLWLASRLTPAENIWDTVLMPLGTTGSQGLGTWIQSPTVAPKSVLLPGYQSSISTKQLGNGNDLFLPACGLLFSGTKSAVLSRWSVGGNSTAAIMERYLVDSQTEPHSQALRRATLALWADEFLIADEPALLPAGDEASALCSGQHPLLWSGYMAIGDTLDN